MVMTEALSLVLRKLSKPQRPRLQTPRLAIGHCKKTQDTDKPQLKMLLEKLQRTGHIFSFSSLRENIDCFALCVTSHFERIKLHINFSKFSLGRSLSTSAERFSDLYKPTINFTDINFQLSKFWQKLLRTQLAMIGDGKPMRLISNPLK